MSLGVTARLTGLAAGERLFATGVGRVAEPSRSRRRSTIRRRPGWSAAAPGSGVAWETLSRQGRRNVATAVRPEQIEKVMGEPAAAEPIRVFVGLESAPTEAERVALAMAELERTGAFDRELLMVISPTGTEYVNYVAVETARLPDPRQHGLGDHAVLHATLAAVTGPGGRGANALPHAGRRHPQRARRAASREAAPDGAVRGEPGRLDQPGRLRPPRHPGPSSRPCAPPNWSANGNWTRPRTRLRTTRPGAVRPAGRGRAPRTRRRGRSRSGGRRRAPPAPTGRCR